MAQKNNSSSSIERNHAQPFSNSEGSFPACLQVMIDTVGIMLYYDARSLSSVCLIDWPFHQVDWKRCFAEIAASERPVARSCGLELC